MTRQTAHQKADARNAFLRHSQNMKTTLRAAQRRAGSERSHISDLARYTINMLNHQNQEAVA